MRFLLAWTIGLTMYAIRLTCRHRTHNDQRADLLASGKTYIYAQLHAHQIGAGMFGEPGTVAMVSRSADASMVVPMLKLFRKIVVRGSSGKATKGGASALQQLIRKVKDGHQAVIAVDGPRGPRGSVQKGIGLLAKKTGMPIVPVVVVPTRRWIFAKTWDRLQIPQPFCRIDFYFGDPVFANEETDLHQLAEDLQATLHDLESEHDPSERAPREAESVSSEPVLRAA
ncbi:hypothetical protein Pla22_17960 [Rubripirellula amarantea]|uniref:DUF374 domain-containing protein n=1 Tax=Rubripirellula amarantea TaxID=2527999 RepID=A0A5C5WVK4_9BACT|nr:lysophospholipid acyltransferase family protein [Rubripirellula amarantea]TWT54161.1 hypothetical protein Pla22_17960 [Rubripirellula amarantea]